MNDRELARWVVAGVFAALWLLFAVGNAAIVFGLAPPKDPTRGQSMTPFVGGLAGAVSCLAAPGIGPKWVWVPLLLDAGSVPMLVMFGVFAMKEALKKR